MRKDIVLGILDEVHHAPAKTWANAAECFPGALLGLTATPWRLSLKQGFPGWNTLVKGPTLKSLIEAERLAPIDVRISPLVKGRGRNDSGDFAMGETSDFYLEKLGRKVSESAVAWAAHTTRKHCEEPKVLVFAMTEAHAQFLVEEFRHHEFRADYISSKTKNREEVVSAFARGDLDVLININILTEGFDSPDANVVIILRPTESLALYLQMVGRGTRYVPGKRLLLLDCTETTEEVGYGHPADVDRLTEWSLSPRDPKGSKGDAPSKRCPYCEDCGGWFLGEMDSRNSCSCSYTYPEAYCGAGAPLAASVCACCRGILRAECGTCGTLTSPWNMKKLEEKRVCSSCIEEYEKEHRRIKVETESRQSVGGSLSARVPWYPSKSTPGNLTKKVGPFRITVMEKSGKYGYIIFEGDSRKAYSWNFSSQKRAVEAGTKRLDQLIAAR